MASLGNSISLTLQIWGPCSWEREYMDIHNHGPVDATYFQECLYSWGPAEDIFGSVINTEQTEQLRKYLMDGFSPSVSPDKRTIQDIEMVIAEIDKIILNRELTSWADSEGEAKLSNGDRINLRQHRLLAFREHIRWVCDTYRTIPGVNVTVR